MFKIKKNSVKSQARLGSLKTNRGQISSPFFMPIATKAAVKSLTANELKKLGAQIILSNSYHLYLRPGISLLKKYGGLHDFMNWTGPILTDSGGYQAFSLAGYKQNKKNLVKLKKTGVEFRSHLDGSRHLFTPAKVLEIQKIIGSDIAMVLDVCTSFPTSYDKAQKDVELTLQWAKISRAWQKKQGKKFKGQIFAIVQGSVYEKLRQDCAQRLTDMDFDGYALGGLAVGETAGQMEKVIEQTIGFLPAQKPRYLMGVGRPENILAAVKLGVDMFDCVIPTREARHGRLYRFCQKDIMKKKFYETISIGSRYWSKKKEPLNQLSSFPEMRKYSYAYLHHLMRSQEPLALRLASLYNLEFYLEFMKKIRTSIRAGRL